MLIPVLPVARFQAYVHLRELALLAKEVVSWVGE